MSFKTDAGANEFTLHMGSKRMCVCVCARVSVARSTHVYTYTRLVPRVRKCLCLLAWCYWVAGS